jgi:plastocyanin
MNKILWMVTMIALVAGLCAVVSGRVFGAAPASPPAAEIAVKIDNFSFSPDTITVPAGSTVRWTNRDDIPHTVVDNNKAFKSSVLDTDEEFTYKFSKPGTYVYFCSLHPKMTAKVVVK